MPSSAANRCRRKFLRVFPGGFRDETYLDWEREYKWETHERWEEMLGRAQFARLLRVRAYDEVAARAIRVEQRSRHSMIFSFEKMALRDAVRSAEGASAFARRLYAFLHGSARLPRRFDTWSRSSRSAAQANARAHVASGDRIRFHRPTGYAMFLKPNVTRAAAEGYDFDFRYASRPNWDTYQSLLDFAQTVGRDVRDLRPRDMIDLQSFIWVQGSDEYAG